MIATLRTFAVFLWRNDLASWRSHRRACMDRLPKAEKASDLENGK